MQTQLPSQTAMAAAFLRALHLVVDEPPPVFEDAAARDLLPDYQRRFLDRLAALPRRWLGVFRQRRSAVGRMRAQIVVRSRYAEDRLAEAREAGAASRHLILAAGLDTFAWRQSAAPLPVVEVDHPATQGWKRHTLAARGWPSPAELTFAPMDFERQRLEDVLQPAGEAQFVTWLGTSYYLSRSALQTTLASLSALCPAGSAVAMDFWQESPPGRDGAALLWGTRIATALQLEPMQTFLEPAELERLASASGWQLSEHLDAAEQNRRYLQGRGDGLSVPGFAHLALLRR